MNIQTSPAPALIHDEALANSDGELCNDTQNTFDIEMLSDHSDPGPTAMPDHIAARIYNRKQRRAYQSSSSRCSSISSLHSKHSSHHGARRHPGDSIVHHLRRASLLDSKRASLADRAAHAENVRLRAAVAAKNSARDALRREKALAAEQTREKLLADITAKCEEEVLQAKRRAKEMNERKAAKHNQLRLALSQKTQEAEKRRVEYQQGARKARHSNDAAGEQKKAVSTCSTANKLDEVSAAGIIQKAWRLHRTRTIISKYSAFDLTLDRLYQTDFDDIAATLCDAKFIDTTIEVLRLFKLVNRADGDTAERGAARTFLSLYPILSHPVQVMSGNGDLEHDLINKSQDLYAVFHQVVAHIISDGVSFATLDADFESLSACFNMYCSAFHAWKSRDCSILNEIMIAQFVELELIWQSVKEDRAGEVATDYQEGIRRNQTLILGRLKSLAGRDEAMKMVRNALKNQKLDQRKRSRSETAVPRVAHESPSAMQELLPVPESSTASAFEGEAEDGEGSALETLDQNKLSPQEQFSKALSSLPDNRVLIHELMINRHYTIDENRYIKPRQQIMSHICNMMRRDFENGRGSDWTVAMTTVIQDKLLRSMKPGTSMHTFISESLDPDFVQQQCKGGQFSYEGFMDLMSTTLPKICAPARDSLVEEFANDTSSDLIDRVAKLMRIIDLLSLDHTNYMLHIATPQLLEEAPGYEQRTFMKGLEEGTNTLEWTRKFWNESQQRVADEMRSRNPYIADTDESPKPPAMAVYAHGLVNLVLENGVFRPEQVPETLHLDRSRLESLRSQGYKIAAIASILLTAKNLLKRDIRIQWKAEAERLMALSFSDMNAERVLSILESNHRMPPSTRQQLYNNIRKALAPLANATSAHNPTPLISVTDEPQGFSISRDPPAEHENLPNAVPPASTTNFAFTDPVSRLMLSRIRAHVLKRLSADNTKDRVRMTASAAQALAAAGMPEFVSEIGQMVDVLGRIRYVDWTSHGPVYDMVSGGSRVTEEL